MNRQTNLLIDKDAYYITQYFALREVGYLDENDVSFGAMTDSNGVGAESGE